MSPNHAPIPLLLDTDIGDDVDDVFALLLAARHPGLHLLGVTTVYGDVAQRSRIARKLLRLGGHGNVPVVTGLGRTLAGRDPGSVMTSGQGFAPDEEPPGNGADAGAVDFLIQQVMASSEPPILAAVGPLTNVGAALRQEPRLATRLRALVVMGGRLGPAADRGEHNVNMDPEATRLVLECGARLRLGTVEVTGQARLAAPMAARLRRSGDAACAGAADMLELYLRQMARQDTAMYDPLTLTLAYGAEFLTMRPVRLQATYAERLVMLEAQDAADSGTDATVAAESAAFIEHLLATITAG
jgi:purine nucleosidase